MKRRTLFHTSGILAAGSGLAAWRNAQAEFSYSGPIVVNQKLPRPENGPIKVAFVIDDGAQMIDFAGPWEVFQDVYLKDGKYFIGQGAEPAFELFTVGKTKDPITVTGGMEVLPKYSIDKTPIPNLIVIPHFAERGYTTIHDWIKRVAPITDLTMSICTGAFQLAKTGLLDNRMATTNKTAFGPFAEKFPKVSLQRGPRFVEVDGFATAGGLTAGIDLALRTVERYFDGEITQDLADFMEYPGEGWKV